MSYRDNLQWDTNGACKYRVHKRDLCNKETNPRHHEPYTDEYGSWQHCPDCRGVGSISRFVYVRVPEFDARKPDEDWVPDWVET
jgi:hypothetical protein